MARPFKLNSKNYSLKLAYFKATKILSAQVIVFDFGSTQCPDSKQQE